MGNEKKGDEINTIDKKLEDPNVVDGESKDSEKETGGFNRSTEGGVMASAKNWLSERYEGLYNIPKVNKIVGKIEIAYSQFWMDRYEKGAIKEKNKIDDCDIKIKTLDSTKERIESMIEKYNISDTVSLKLELTEIEKIKMKEIGKKDRIKSKFEKFENKTKLFTNERDRIADKLIDYYSEKLRPMEEELENLQEYRDKIDLQVSVMEIRHKNLEKENNILKNEKKKIEQDFIKIGYSRRKIPEAVKLIENMLTEKNKIIKKEKKYFKLEERSVNKRIAKIDAKVNPYRDKYTEFMRVKGIRPSVEGMPVRKKVEELKEKEVIKSHLREEGSESNPILKKNELKSEIVGEDESKEQTMTSYISKWNKFLKEKYKDDVSDEIIKKQNFLETIGPSYGGGSKLSFEDFKQILVSYCKYREKRKNISTKKLNESIDKFEEEIVSEN